MAWEDLRRGFGSRRLGGSCGLLLHCAGEIRVSEKSVERGLDICGGVTCVARIVDGVYLRDEVRVPYLTKFVSWCLGNPDQSESPTQG